MAALVWLVVGLVLQLVGAYLTLRGSHQAWAEVRRAEDKFLAPIVAAGRKVRAPFVRMYHRIRPLPVRVAVVSAAMAGAGAFATGMARATPGRLPTDLSTEDAMKRLDDNMHRYIAQTDAALDALRLELRTKLDPAIAEHERLTRELAENDEAERRNVVRGLRIEVYGFILITVGALVQAVGSFYGIDWSTSPQP